MDSEKRQFEVELSDGKKVKLTTRMPTNVELQESEDEYSVAFNRAIMKGIMPEATLMDSFIKNGIWSESKDQEVEEQRLKVVELEEKLESEIGQTDKQIIAKSLSEEREKLYQKRQQRTQLLSHSAESKAEDAQRNFIVSKVTELDSSGVAVWSTYNDFKTEVDGNLIFRATYEYLTLANGLPSDFVEQLPENQVSKESESNGDEPASVTLAADASDANEPDVDKEKA
jgi:hypothetical protein